MAQKIRQAIEAVVVVFINHGSVGNGRHPHGIGLDTGGAAVMDNRLCGHEPGNHVALIGHPHPTTLGSDGAINFLILCGVRADNNVVFRELFF